MITQEELNLKLADPNLIILYVSDSDSCTDAESIPGTIHVSIAFFACLKSKLPNTLPSQEQFESIRSQIGVSPISTVVIYENSKIYFGPRIWFLFRLFGHEQVSLLNATFQSWKLGGFPVGKGFNRPNKTAFFKSALNKELIWTLGQVKANIKAQNFTLVDARAKDRFTGRVEEQRKGLRSGNIPGSCNLPYANLLSEGVYKSIKQIKIEFESLSGDKRPVFYCGSGVTACIVGLAYYEITGNLPIIYDGSWTEWATIFPTELN